MCEHAECVCLELARHVKTQYIYLEISRLMWACQAYLSGVSKTHLQTCQVHLSGIGKTWN